jgi:glycosyltransferase involved in cell wall biosynthesis
MNDLVSIIIPVYNRENLVKETLESILSQTYQNWECVLVDDGSTDRSLEVVNTYAKIEPRIKIFERPRDRAKGANACRNYGFEKSKGDYILFLDSDDLLKNTCLERRQAEFITDENIDFIIVNTSYYSDGIFLSKPICEYPSNYSKEKYLELFLKYELPWTIMSVLWKRETIVNVKFDETLLRLQDIDFHIQVLLQKNIHCTRLNKVDNYYRSDTKSKLSIQDQKKVIIASRLFFQKYLNSFYLNGQQSKHFRRFIILFLIKYIYPFQKQLKNEVEKVEDLISKSSMFSFKELLVLKLYKSLIKLNLHNSKGLGMYRLTQLLKRSLNYA